jgi:deoxyribodipyrimidine photo-lyase
MPRQTRRTRRTTVPALTVMLFHRDLRLYDHNTLAAAVAHAKETKTKLYPLFVFTPTQVTRNPLKSHNSIQFMIASLEELSTAIREDGGGDGLQVAYGETAEVLRALSKRAHIEALFETQDYTPYALRRQESLAEFCKSANIKYNLLHDIYIHAPGSVKNRSGKTFQKFTPFYEKARRLHVPEPTGAVRDVPWFQGGASGTRRAHSTSLASMRRKLIPAPNEDIAVRGGRAEALQLLRDLPRNYAVIHDIPASRTSMLSAHNHFGTVSIREVYARGCELGLTEFVRQLFWRDFYGHIMADFENLYGVGAYEFQRDPPRAYTAKQKTAWRDWCRGTTGVPLVDAGMRELLATGYMHNRVRLVVASWLTKTMGIHWRHGERFFAKHLVDYDATQNMMNWIWVASALPFASAPFRSVGAETTARRFDADGTYVNKWLTEK